MKRKTLACLFCSLFAVGMLFLTGCGSSNGSGNSDQDAISKDLTSRLDSFNSSGRQKLAEELKANSASLKNLGIDCDDFAKELLDGFTYKIGTISVNSEAGSATAEVNLTSRTVGSVLTAFENNIADALSNLKADDVSTEDKINNVIGDQLMEAAKSADMDTTTFTLSYSKIDDTWTMDDLEAQFYQVLGLDTISIDSIYSKLGVSSSSELASYINQHISK